MPGNATASVDNAQLFTLSLVREMVHNCYTGCRCWLEGQNMRWDPRDGGLNPGGSKEMRGDLDQGRLPRGADLKLILKE